MHYKFIDIGCGNTNVSVDQYGLAVRGLLVEPVKEFCGILPTSTSVIAENSAITDYDGEINMSVGEIDTENLMYFPIQALSTIKHVERLCKRYKLYGIESLAKDNSIHNTRVVSCLRLETLLQKYDIDEVDQFKIDVEGHENVILTQLIELMRANKFKVNERIIFEYNQLSDKQELDQLARLIATKFGFTYEFKQVGWNEDIVMTKIPTHTNV